MHISEFDYELPDELIAQHPLSQRDSSRMLVLNRQSGSWLDSTFREFPNQLNDNDLVVINNTRVIPARLIGRRPESVGKVEVFLVRETEPGSWQVLVRPGSRLRAGARVIFGEDQLECELLDEPGTDLRHVRFRCEGPFDNALAAVGSTPLPPYIKRPEGVLPSDNERYQTVYSKAKGAIAAPTAGLHFTGEMLSTLRARDQLAEITLHVGYGTFEPVRADDVSQHRVSAERFEILPNAAERIRETKRQGGRLIAVGTTTTRALEAAATEHGVVPGPHEASLTILPGYQFKMVDVLLTNFHLPRSSLLILISAFAGRELILEAYRHAVAERYRFYSYGDCMLIL